MIIPFTDTSAQPHVRGFLHQPAQPNGSALILTHGAGANCQTKLLLAMADAFAATGVLVLRFDLPFRIERRFGPPRPGDAARDRDGLRRAVLVIREQLAKISPDTSDASPTKRATSQTPAAAEKSPPPQRVFLAGHSYGGRQSTILASEDSALADALLLLSYPLHPPQKPAQLRTAHFPQLQTPAFFVHGTKDPFGTLAEMQSALQLLSAPHALFAVDGAAHDLLLKKAAGELPLRVAGEFQQFVAKVSPPGKA